MNEPIPFLGWLSDIEDTEEMLREQIHAMNERIKSLESVVHAYEAQLKGLGLLNENP